MIEVKNTLEGKLNASIVKEYPELEEITITPTLDGQELESNKYGYSKITVERIPAIDISIEPTTEEQIKTGIFKRVKVEAVQGETLDITPTEQSQAKTGIFTQVNINPIQVEEITTDLDFSSGDAIELTAQEGAYIKKATINKDVNLSPENIKSGVTIAGVSGDVADTSDADATSDDIVAGKTAYVANEKIQGTFKPLDTSDATATAEDIAEGKIAYVNGEKIIGTLKLPYIKLEYIESNGNQYIDTDVKATANTGAELTVRCPNSYTQDTGFFGVWKTTQTSNGEEYDGIMFGRSKYLGDGFAIATSSLWNYSGAGHDTNWHTYIYDPINHIATIDGVNTGAPLNDGVAENIHIFKANIYPGTEKLRISSCKIYKDGELFRHYIPVKRKSDNEVCMYELVGQRFVLNAGTGSFIAGPEIQ